MRIVVVALVLIGLSFVVLSVLIPILMGATTEYGVGAAIRLGFVRVLTPFITNLSMASSFVVAAVILTFERSRANTASIVFGILTLSAFLAEISLSVYLSVVRPRTTGPPLLLVVYLLIGLVPLGMGFTMFTLASIMSAR